MRIYIKNMVCQGTRKFVLMELKKLGLIPEALEMDEIVFRDELSGLEINALRSSLMKFGLEITDQKVNQNWKHNIAYSLVEPASAFALIDE